MSDRPYPESLAEIEKWRLGRNITSEEARKRFVQYVVLDLIASADWADQVAFKGGNALRFGYGSPRSTVDLDFTAAPDFPDDASTIRSLLDSALSRGLHRHLVRARCQSIRRNPRSPQATHPTYDISVAYQLPGDRQYESFDQAVGIKTVIRLEISLNDVVCEFIPQKLSAGAAHTLRVCSLEDILAEKLRALLQQPIRNCSRPQDVYDIARIYCEDRGHLDLTKISRFLLRKAESRNIPVARSAFDQGVRRRASQEYGHLFEAQDPDQIPFDDAWLLVLELVRRLDIPD